MNLPEEIPKFINNINNETLIKPFTLSKVEVVIKSMPLDKSSSPDGLSYAFYRLSWDRIKYDFVDALNHFSFTKQLHQ